MPPKKPREQPTGLEDYLGQAIVIDTRSTYVFIGTLTRIDRDFVTLDAVDVHDSTETRTTKEHYIMEAAKLGVRTNRRGAKVRLFEIIAISRLEDVETY